jgi:hypothetical protein
VPHRRIAARCRSRVNRTPELEEAEQPRRELPMMGDYGI